VQILELDKYCPSPEWFAHKPYGVHGIAHVTRVLVWANLIGRKLIDNSEKLDLEAVHWASVLHDIGRITDLIDPGHGERAAAWVAQNRNNLFSGLEDETLNRIIYCCTWHQITDKDIPQLTAELQCVKDGDGLDRVRIHDLNPDFLRIRFSRDFVDSACTLYKRTKHSGEPWTEVRNVALEMGLWR
jgi:hypothetical protein